MRKCSCIKRKRTPICSASSSCAFCTRNGASAYARFGARKINRSKVYGTQLGGQILQDSLPSVVYRACHRKCKQDSTGDGVTRKCRRCSRKGRRPVRSRIADRAPRSPTFVSTARYVDGSTHRDTARCRELHSSDGTSSGSTDVESTESGLRVSEHAVRSNELLRNSPVSTSDDMANVELVLLHAAAGRATGRGAARGHSLRAVRGSAAPPPVPLSRRDKSIASSGSPS